MRLGHYDIIYFIGIGGIGMSALARWFNQKGFSVSGYDRTPTTLTKELEAEGMPVHFEDSISNIPAKVLENKEKTLVVFTPAIPKDHSEYNYFVKEGYTIMKRSEVLGLITNDYTAVAVAGTHGKTTTSSMIAHILKTAQADMAAFLGGITTNYHSNLLMEGKQGDRMVVVVEADEFDRSFLKLFPTVAVVTSADPDHLDIYGDHDALLASFRSFISQVKTDGTLIIHESLKSRFTNTPERTYSYGINQGQFFASHISPTSAGFFEFDLNGFESVEHITLGVPGFHNVENAVAAAVAAHASGIGMPVIKKALASFRGVKRRFEYVLNTDKVVFIDDYAHHPAEIDAFLRSVRGIYPTRKITVVFQPHLYTRTRDFADGFAETLSLADELLLMDIYPARELPIPGVDSDMIFNKVESKVKVRCNKGNVIEKLRKMDVEVLATVGAGDIDTFVEPIKQMLEKKYEV